MTWSELKYALRFPMADHIRIRLCMMSEKARSRRGLLRPPEEGETYGPEILPDWAEKTVEAFTRRQMLDDLNLPGRWLRRLVEYSDRAALFALKHAGRGGVSWLAFAVGLLCGVPFLMIRILRPTMGYVDVLIPVFYALLFVSWHLFYLIRWLIGLRDVTETTRSPTRQIWKNVTLYTRWLGNLFWLGLWTVVCMSVMLMTFTVDRDDFNFKWNASRRIETRLHLHRVIGALAGPWKLPDEHIAYADKAPMYKFSSVEPGQDHTLKYVERRRNKETVLANTFRPEEHSIYLVYSPPDLEEGQHVIGVIFRVGTSDSLDSDPPYVVKKEVEYFCRTEENQVISVVHMTGSRGITVNLKEEELVFTTTQDKDTNLILSLNGKPVTANINKMDALFDRPMEITRKYLDRSESQHIWKIVFHKSVPVKVSKVEKPQNYVGDWLDFLAALTFFCGVLLHLLALPVFGVLVMVRRVQLYQEYSKEPYTEVLRRLNERPFERAGDRGIHVAIDGNGDGEDIDQAPHGWDILVVAYKVEIAEGEEKRYGEGAGRFPRMVVGNAKTANAVMEWIKKERGSANKLVIVCSLKNTPDNPFHDFMKKVMTSIYCELDFKELWKSSRETITDTELRERIELWNQLVIKQKYCSSESALILSPALEKYISRENQGHA